MNVYKQGDFYIIMDSIGLSSDQKITCNFGFYASKQEAEDSLTNDRQNNLAWSHIICDQVEGEDNAVTATRALLDKMPTLTEV